MGYFKSIWGIQLAFSNLMYDYKTDDRNKATKSDKSIKFQKMILSIVQQEYYVR